MAKIIYADPQNKQHEVSKDEFMQLVKRGEIIETTPVIINGRPGQARQIAELSSFFASQRGNTESQQTVKTTSDRQTPSSPQAAKTDLSLQSVSLGITKFFNGLQNALTERISNMSQAQTPPHSAEISENVAKNDSIQEANLEDCIDEFQEVQKNALQFLVTTGSNFEGYQITQFCGLVSADDAFLLDRSSAVLRRSNEVSSDLLNEVPRKRMNILNKMKRQAELLGANALLGIDFKTVALSLETVNMMGGTLYEPYLFSISGTGTAVVIQKIR